MMETQNQAGIVISTLSGGEIGPKAIYWDYIRPLKISVHKYCNKLYSHKIHTIYVGVWTGGGAVTYETLAISDSRVYGSRKFAKIDIKVPLKSYSKLSDDELKLSLSMLLTEGILRIKQRLVNVDPNFNEQDLLKDLQLAIDEYLAK